jgi:hypothetical protein
MGIAWYVKPFGGMISESLKERTPAEILFIGVPWSLPHYHQVS